jgi:hypothetical protein
VLEDASTGVPERRRLRERLEARKPVGRTAMKADPTPFPRFGVDAALRFSSGYERPVEVGLDVPRPVRLIFPRTPGIA